METKSMSKEPTPSARYLEGDVVYEISIVRPESEQEEADSQAARC